LYFAALPFLRELKLTRANQRLCDLLSLWNEMRGGKTMASRTDFSVRALKPWLGNLALIDIGCGERATFRLCGTNLMVRFGGEFTNRHIAELSDAVRPSVEAYVRGVCRSCAPKDGTHGRVIDGTFERFRELCLPLSDTGARVTTLLLASIPIRTNEI
jgi:hypothetical protein